MTSTSTGPEEAVEAAPRPSLWRNRDFVMFWLGESISLFGTQVTTLALPLTAVLVFNASTEQVGLLRFAQLVPYFGLALLFGVWVDRVRRRPVMLFANLLRMALIALVPLLSYTDHLSMTPLLLIAGGIGIASVLFDVSWMSYVPSLIRDPKDYVEAYAKLGVTSSSADVAGPGIAGMLVGALTAPIALIVDACSYFASLITLMLIKAEEKPPPPVANRRLRTELAEGWNWVLRDRILRPLVLMGPACNFCMISVQTLFIVYAIREAGLSPFMLGFVLSASAVGGLLGASISRKVIGRFPLGRVYLYSMAAIFLAPALIPLADGPKQVVAVMFVASFFISYLGLGVVQVVMISLRQTCTPAALMGRMNAVFRMLLFGGGAVAGPIGGFIAGAVGLRTALAILAVISASLLVPLALSPVSALKELPAPAVDALK
ncbi:MAG TPA: MFS transporter [Jatrophihabitans sp.]|jgi:MFS family permease|uniref:MFS transporter n=1 Tax=Jatrophihabitans sp. TaxID=1932789 RepID=UPI002F211286